jgi:hypothetical protein
MRRPLKRAEDHRWLCEQLKEPPGVTFDAVIQRQKWNHELWEREQARPATQESFYPTISLLSTSLWEMTFLSLKGLKDYYEFGDYRDLIPLCFSKTQFSRLSTLSKGGGVFFAVARRLLRRLFRQLCLLESTVPKGQLARAKREKPKGPPMSMVRKLNFQNDEITDRAASKGGREGLDLP